MKWARTCHTHTLYGSHERCLFRLFNAYANSTPSNRCAFFLRHLLYFALFCFCQVSWSAIFFLSFEWCALAVYSHIKVSLSLITANHRVRTYTIDFFHFFPFFHFFLFIHFWFCESQLSSPSTASELQLLLPPRHWAWRWALSMCVWAIVLIIIMVLLAADCSVTTLFIFYESLEQINNDHFMYCVCVCVLCDGD